jgi:hypothetical protein
MERAGRDKDYIFHRLSFPTLHNIIQAKLSVEGLYWRPFIRTEFVCSDRGKIGSLESYERVQLVTKLKHEKGVTVLEVPQHTQKQRRRFHGFHKNDAVGASTVDAAQPHHIVLIASGTDHIPALRLLAEQGTHVIIVGFLKSNPPTLKDGANQRKLFSFGYGRIVGEDGKKA